MFQADSAYEADEESITPNSSPEPVAGQRSDPYDVNLIDDPADNSKGGKKMDRKKCTTKQSTKKCLKKVDTCSKHKKCIPTSTPVLKSSASESTVEKFSSETPEVTPILPVKSREITSALVDDFTTPQVPRSSRKRSLQPASLPSISTQLSYSSQADSGIALSPVLKKNIRTLDAGKHILHCKSKFLKKHIGVSKIRNKKKAASTCVDDNVKKKNIFTPIAATNVPEVQMRVVRKRKKGMEDSCFGFNSSENIPPPAAQARDTSKSAKKSAPSNDSYRTADPSSSDSSPYHTTDSPELFKGLESSPENLPRYKSSSPTLFSDTFSADSGMC